MKGERNNSLFLLIVEYKSVQEAETVIGTCKNRKVFPHQFINTAAPPTANKLISLIEIVTNQWKSRVNESMRRTIGQNMRSKYYNVYIRNWCAQIHQVKVSCRRTIMHRLHTGSRFSNGFANDLKCIWRRVCIVRALQPAFHASIYTSRISFVKQVFFWYIQIYTAYFFIYYIYILVWSRFSEENLLQTRVCISFKEFRGRGRTDNERLSILVELHS